MAADGHLKKEILDRQGLDSMPQKFTAGTIIDSP